MCVTVCLAFHIPAELGVHSTVVQGASNWGDVNPEPGLNCHNTRYTSLASEVSGYFQIDCELGDEFQLTRC